MAAKDNLHQAQFEQHIADFAKETGVQVYGTHTVAGNTVIPTVRTTLMTRQKDGKRQYYMEAHVPGQEGNLHHLTVTNYHGPTFYGLSLSQNARGDENLDTHDLEEFSRGVRQHLAKATEFPPSGVKQENEIMNERAAVRGHYNEWHERNKLRAVEVTDWDTNEHATRVYDPVTKKYL